MKTPLPPIDFTKRAKGQADAFHINEEAGLPTYFEDHSEKVGQAATEADNTGDRTSTDPGPVDIPSKLGEWNVGNGFGLIPPRGWLLANTFCRRFVSCLIGGGGAGKTALRIVQALAVATGRQLTGEHVFQRGRVLFVSLEDNYDELCRRLWAAMKHYKIEPKDVDDWLFVATPAQLGLKLASTVDREFKMGDLGAVLENAIELRGIDVAILDPFVKAHSVSENDNNFIDKVANVLADIADRHNCAIDVLHHIAKGPSDPGNADKGRGASALKDACRLVHTLTPMTSDEAKALLVDVGERHLLVRLDSGKVNIAPPATKARWFRLVAVSLGNGNEIYRRGDEVQTVEPWSPPDAWEGLSHFTLNQILDEIDKGLPDGRRYSAHHSAEETAAWKVVQRHVPDKSEQQCKQVIGTWVREDVLSAQEYTDPIRRKPAKGLRLEPSKRPS